MTYRLLIVPLLAVVLLAGAATPALAANKETLQMMADIRMLQEQAQRLQILLGSLTDALKAVNTRLDQQTENERRAFADQKLSIDSLSSDLRIVREKVDDSNVRIGSISQEVDALRQTVVRMSMPPPAPIPATTDLVAGTPGAAPTDAPPAVDPLPPPVAEFPPPPPPAVGASPQRLWDAAFADYGAGHYELAAIGFESYAKSFPRSDQADNALVFVASAYLQDGNNEKALEAADFAIRSYPTGDAVPEAYLRKAQALSNLRQVDRAREAFEHVLKNYPDTAASTMASQGLQRLKPLQD
jgi:TolA-binding protein